MLLIDSSFSYMNKNLRSILYTKKQILSGPIRTLCASKNVVAELRFMAKHIDRKSNEVIFQKCSDPRCSHCSTRPILSKMAWEFLKHEYKIIKIMKTGQFSKVMIYFTLIVVSYSNTCFFSFLELRARENLCPIFCFFLRHTKLSARRKFLTSFTL